MRTRSDHALGPIWEGDTQPIALPRKPTGTVPPAVLVGVSLWRLLIVGCALYGFSDATGWSENFEGLSQQASLLAALVYLGLLVYPAFTGGRRHEPESPWLRGATAVLLLLVAGTFFGIMGGDLDYLPFEHVYTPLLVLVDWLAVGRNQERVRWWYPLTWIAFPLAYLVYFLSAELYHVLYPFLDPRSGGFAVMVAVLLAGVIAIGYLLHGAAVLRRALLGAHPARLPGHSSPPLRRLLVGAAVAALLVAVVVGGWSWSSGGGDHPSAAAAQEWAAAADEAGPAQELWRIPQGDVPGVHRVEDHWVTDTHLVRRLPGRVVSYDLATGEVTWELPLPNPEDECRSSQQQSGNRVALLLVTGGERSSCGTLLVLDIATGQEVFTTEIPPIDRTKVEIADVPVVVGQYVLVGSRAGGHLFNIDTGAHVTVSEEGKCREDAYAVVDDLLVARVSCRERPPGGDVVLNGLRVYDAELDQLWSWQAPTDGDKPLVVENVLSVDPLVVELFSSRANASDVVRVDPSTGESVTFATWKRPRGFDYRIPCDGRGIAHCQEVRITDGTLILTAVSEPVNPGAPGSYPEMNTTEFRNELVGFDLGTGEEKWRTGIVPGRQLQLVPTTDGSLVAYQPANTNDVPGLLLAVDAGTGAVTPLLPIGAESHEDDEVWYHLASDSFGGDGQQAVWTGDRFVIFRMVHRAAQIGELETVAFGASR